MGRQVNFWVLEQDAQEFVQYVLSEPNVVMISDLESTGPYLRIITELPRPPERWWWSVYFWNQDFPFEPKWVQVREGPDRGLYAFAPSNQDPVIQFHRSVLRESGELSQGRIWTGCRNETFLRWYERVARWIRRRYERVQEWEAWAAYAGPQAYEWYQAGGILGR
jgi:hypothetical protein